MRVLVADANPLICHMVTNSLREDTGVRVTSVGNGKDALAYFERPNPPNLFILDWDMPQVNGLEVCRRIRATMMADYTYIILLSSRPNKVDVLVALEAGADDCLTKPFNRDELVKRVHTGFRLIDREKRLTAITQSWRAMLDNLPYGVACISREGLLQRANQTLFTMLGYPEMRALLNKNVAEQIFASPEDVEYFSQLVKDSSPFPETELEVLKWDKSVLRVFASGQPIETPNGRAFELILRRVESTLVPNSKPIAAAANF